MLNFKKFLNINIHQVVNFFLISKSTNKKLTFIFYLIFISLFIAIFYLLSPKLLNYSSREFIILEALKAKSSINIKKFKNINYRIFPTPRLVIKESNFDFHKDFILVENSNIHIILNLKGLLRYKNFDYRRIFVEKSNSKIFIKNLSKSINIINKNQKKINFTKSKFNFIGKEKKLFEISDVDLVIKKKNSEDIFNLSGFLLQKKIFINFSHKGNKNNNLSLKLPDIDSSIKIFFQNNENKNRIVSGLTNLEVLNNFFQFDFTVNDRLEIANGFVRNKSVNSSVKGYLNFDPNFYFDLHLEPNMFNVKNIFQFSLEQYLLPNMKSLKFAKKLNGKLDLKFKDLFQGEVLFENGSISLKNFLINKKNEFIKLETSIEDLNSTKKVVFDFQKKLNGKKNREEMFNIKGQIIPVKNKVVLKKIFLNNKELSKEKIKFYEKKFNEQIVDKNLVNIFNSRKFNRFFKNFSK